MGAHRPRGHDQARRELSRAGLIERGRAPAASRHAASGKPRDEARKPRAGAFFGRRKGHRLRPHQVRLFETLLPKLALAIDGPAPSDLRSLFSPQVETVHLEIGFGSGEHLIAQAEAHPRIGFIGCEAFVNGMAKTLAAIEARGFANIRLHFGDAVDLIGWAPGSSLARVDLFYPDPWPKRRHWKRRFIQDARIGELARIIRPGGELRFATDIAHYAAWTLVRFLRSPRFEWTAERADDWRRPWPDFTHTRYETKAIRAGRRPCYLTFRRRQ
jgi:tRNA (guanine-N7-)-methyltransferase